MRKKIDKSHIKGVSIPPVKKVTGKFQRYKNKYKPENDNK
jgi:hypothetical protein